MSHLAGRRRRGRKREREGERESNPWILGSTNENTCPYCPVLINSFLGSKAIHTAVSQHALCLYSMGKSRPLCFTSVFWLSDAVHIHDRDKVHLKKTAVSCRYEIPFRIGIMGRTVSNSHTAIYGCFKLIISSGIGQISCNDMLAPPALSSLNDL